MIEEIKNINTSKKDLRSFGYTIGTILFIISAVLFYYNNQLYQNLTVIAAIFVVLGGLIPQLLKPVYLVWMTFAVILGWVMTRVILSVIFYLIMTPIGFLSKILGEDFLELKKRESDSFWNQRDSSKELSQDYEKQF